MVTDLGRLVWVSLSTPYREINVKLVRNVSYAIINYRLPENLEFNNILF